MISTADGALNFLRLGFRRRLGQSRTGGNGLIAWREDHVAEFVENLTAGGTERIPLLQQTLCNPTIARRRPRTERSNVGRTGLDRLIDLVDQSLRFTAGDGERALARRSAFVGMSSQSRTPADPRQG